MVQHNTRRTLDSNEFGCIISDVNRLGERFYVVKHEALVVPPTFTLLQDARNVFNSIKVHSWVSSCIVMQWTEEIHLNTSHSYCGALQWLEEHRAELAQCTHRIVHKSYPIFTNGQHGEDRYELLANYYPYCETPKERVFYAVDQEEAQSI